MDQLKTVQKVKALITLDDGTDFFGFIYVPDAYRLQDVVNDARQFLPIEQLISKRGRSNEDYYTLVLINKNAIRSIEER